MISALPCLVEPLLSAEENNSIHVLFGLLQGPGLIAGNFPEMSWICRYITSVFSWPCLVEGNRVWMEYQRHCGYSEYMIHSWEQTSLESLLHNDIGEMHISLILQFTWTRSARHETLRQQHLMMATVHFIAYYPEKNKVHGAEIVLANREMLKISVSHIICYSCESVCVCGELSWVYLMITFRVSLTPHTHRVSWPCMYCAKEWHACESVFCVCASVRSGDGVEITFPPRAASDFPAVHITHVFLCVFPLLRTSSIMSIWMLMSRLLRIDKNIPSCFSPDYCMMNFDACPSYALKTPHF